MPDSYIDILQPAAGTNYIANPSFEFDTSGWATFFPAGSTAAVAISSGFQYIGAYSLSVAPSTFPKTGTFGVQYTTPSLPAGTQSVTVSCQVYTNTNRVRLSVLDQNGTAIANASATVAALAGSWQPLSVTYTETGGTIRTVRIDNTGAVQSDAFYLDAVQFEFYSKQTTYIDGDQDDCNWLGAPHNSPSARIARTTSGGVWRNLTTDLNVQLLEVPGFGMPPVTPVLQKYALLSGGYYQRTQPNVRPFTIAASVIGTSLAGMYALRNNLIARVIPDQNEPMQPISIRYTGQGGKAIIRAVYEGGLEIANRAGFTEAIGAKFVAPDPFWYAENDQGTTLLVGTQGTFVGMVAQINNQWGTFNYPGTAYQWINSALGTNNTIYLVGTTAVGGGGSQNQGLFPYTPINASLYSGDSGWGSQITVGITRYSAITTDAANNVYVAGLDTSLISPTDQVLRVHKITGTTASLIGTIRSAVTNGWVINSMVASQSGSVFVGGSFGSFQVSGTIKNLAVYDGSNWYGFASYPNDTIYGMRSVGDTLYLAGTFTATASGSTLLRVGQYSETTGAFSQIGNGLNNAALDIEVAPDGKIYTVGYFTASGAQSIAGSAAVYNGNTWSGLGGGIALGTSLTNAKIKARANGDILFYGLKNRAETNNPGIVRWNGYSFTTLDVWIAGKVTSVVEVESDLYLTSDRVANNGLLVNPIVATVNNTGSASASPIFRFTSTAAATIVQITNYTTGAAIYLNLPIAAGEVITIDTRQGRVAITSSRFGNRIAYLLAGSQFASFDLLPGTNSISAFAYQLSGSTYIGASPQVTCAVYWRRKQWSADAI